VRNNVGGTEGEVRERFEEPSWNNPVVRFLDGNGDDVIARKDRVWATGALLERMTLALRAADREVPRWLREVTTEARGGETEKAVFSMW
jgi:hypothetical protein